MSFLSSIFHTVLYQPFFNGFVGVYHVIPDVGIVILIITVILKLVLYPLTGQSIKAQKAMTELQPKLQEIKEKHKDDQQAIAQATMQLYRDHKINPLGSCLPILIQLPIFIALYWVLRDIFVLESFEGLLYAFVTDPGSINPQSLNMIDLAKPSYLLAIFAAAGQFWQARFFMQRRKKKAAEKGTEEKKASSQQDDMMKMVNKQMLYFMPVMTLLIGTQLPGGLALYWFLSTVLTGLQQVILFREKPGVGKESDAIEGTIVEEKKK